MDIYIAQPNTNEQAKALKAFMKALDIDFKITKNDEGESPYNPEFVTKILKSKQDFLDGKGTTVTIDELKALCK